MTLHPLFRRGVLGNWRLIVLWVSGAVTVGLSLVMPQEVGRLTNLFGSRTSPASWPVARNAVLLMILAQVGISAISYVRRRVQAVHTEMTTRELTLAVFGRVMKFPPDFFRNSEVAKINTRVLDDSNSVSNFQVSVMVGVPLAVLSVIVFGAIMIVRSPLLGSCMVPMSMLSAYYLFFDRRIQAVNRTARQTWDGIRADANEMISAVAEFRNHNAFEYGEDRLNRGLLRYQLVMMDIGKLSALFQAASPLVASVQTGMLYFVGTALCLRGTMQWGDVISFLLLAQLFQRPVSDLASFGLSWRMSRESVRRIEEILEKPCAFEANPGAPAIPESADILYEQASVSTESGGLILNSFTSEIRPGEHVAFCGPAGCGKTTAIQLLIRNVWPSAGRVTFAGKPVETYALDSLARRIGFVPQKPAILNMSLRNNLLLGLRRQVGGELSDSEGPLDVDYLVGIKSEGDLNARLIQVIGEAGLEGDVFNKCMESGVSKASSANALIQRLAELRRLISAKLDSGDGDVIPLARDQFFPGTIGENLFGPGFTSSTSLETAADAFVRCAGDSPILTEILKLGLFRLRRERALAVRVLNRAPSLVEVLDLRPMEAEKSLSEELSSTDLARLRMLPRRLQIMLVETALEEAAMGNFGPAPSGTFQDRILQMRRKLIEGDETARGRWQAMESEGPIEGLTVRENLMRGRCHPQRRDALDLADRVIQDVLVRQNLVQDALLLGLEFRAGEEGNFLSGGQKQKVAIARILMKDPGILLLDEATSAMDEVSQRRIVELVASRFVGRTVVAISHRLSTIRDYDRILLLDRGRLIESGPFDQLVGAGGLFLRLVQHETGGVAPLLESDNYDSTIARQLSLCPLFADLSSDRLLFLARAAKVFDFRAGELLFRRGEPGEEIFVILEGEVEFFMPEGAGAGEKVIARYQPGRAFGELAVFGQGVRSLSARAVTALRVSAIGREKLLSIMAAEPQISLALLKALSQRIVELTDARAA